MKDLITVLFVTAVTAFVWGYMDAQDIAYVPPKEVRGEILEIATPIDGTIDTEFLEELAE
jgi:hypothetical protein